MSVEIYEAFRGALIALVFAMPMLSGLVHGQTNEETFAAHKRHQARRAALNAERAAMAPKPPVVRLIGPNDRYVIIPTAPPIRDVIARQAELAEERRRAAIARRQYRNHRSLLAAGKSRRAE